MNEGDISTISWANQTSKPVETAPNAPNTILKGLNEKPPTHGQPGPSQTHKNHLPPSTPPPSQPAKEQLVPAIKVENIQLDSNNPNTANTFNKLFDDGGSQPKLTGVGTRANQKGNVTMSFEKKAGGNVKITPKGGTSNAMQENAHLDLGQNILEPELTNAPIHSHGSAADLPAKKPAEVVAPIARSPAPPKQPQQQDPVPTDSTKDNIGFVRNSPSQTVESSKTMVMPQRAEKPYPQTTSFSQSDASVEELQKLRSANLELKSELGTLKHSFEDYQIQKEKDIQRLKKDIEDKDANIKRLLEERKEAAKLKKDYELKQLEIAELKESLDNLQSTQPEIVRLNKLNAAHLATIENERDHADKLKARCTNLEQEVRSKNEEIKSLRDKIQDQTKSLSAKENDFAQEQERREQLSKEKIRSLEQSIVISCEPEQSQER